MFHDDIKYVITVGQFFGILPITNVLNTSEKISFSWYSKTIIYCYVIIAGTIFMCIMSFIKLTEDRFSIHGFDSFFFNVNGLLICVLFVKLAHKWSKFNKAWMQLDGDLKICTHKGVLTKKVYLILVVSLTAAAVEHILAMIHTFTDVSDGAEEVMGKIELYFKEDYGFIFTRIPYSIVLGVFVFMASAIVTYEIFLFQSKIDID
ncbi:uncharacterized protein LOC109600282 [Aethina tumida]|uniref:uncharacterized protein LOC109600282 n=1 Tax=Aethina tumida TaxID=116153 RepID=UPI0021485638|nr:uncharacterized protein LOC109600282 [Aethina tumida]